MTKEKAMEVLIRARKTISPVGPLHEAIGVALEQLDAGATDTDVGDKSISCSHENDLISRQAATKKILGQPPELHYPSWYAEQIKELPPAEPELIKCDYVKACNEVTMNKTFSAWRYLDMLDDFEEEGYILVKRRG